MDLSLINLIISCILVGLIWVIQLVHYPTFEFVDTANFQAFHQHHTTSITIIVMPLMLAELGLALYLAKQQPSVYLGPLILVGLIWLSTFIIQVPIHNTLGQGKDSFLIEKLVNTNWIRTILWTIKAGWVGYLFYSNTR